MSKDLCDQIDQPATSLLVETGQTYDKELILKCLAKHIVEEIELLAKSGFEIFQVELNQRLAFLVKKLKLKIFQKCWKEFLRALIPWVA